MRHLWRAAPRHLVNDLLPTTVNNKDNVDACLPHTGTPWPVPLPQQPHLVQTLCPLSDTRVLSVIISCSVFQNTSSILWVHIQHLSPLFPSARSILPSVGKVHDTHWWISTPFAVTQCMASQESKFPLTRG